jgi:hypothetical protein
MFSKQRWGDKSRINPEFGGAIAEWERKRILQAAGMVRSLRARDWNGMGIGDAQSWDGSS